MLSLFTSVTIFIIIFSICPFRQSTAKKSYNVTTDIIMEKKIVYLKLFQIVLTLTIIWQLISLRQFCGTFTDPKTFLCGLSKGDRYTLIGRDSKTGEVGDAFHHHKWHNQFFMNSTNGQLTEEQQRQFYYFLLAKMPPAGHECIPITISPFDWILEWIGKDKNLLNNGTLFYFSAQLFCALCSLGILCYGIMKMLRSVEEYEIVLYWYAFASILCWCLFVVCSIILVLYWKEFWSFVNFQANEPNVPLVTYALSLIMVLSSIFEIVHKSVLNDVDMESANMMIVHPQQQPKKNSQSACAIE